MDIFYPIIGKQKCLPFYVFGIGVTDPEYHIVREEGLISHQILFTKAGAGELLVDGRKYILEKGSLLDAALIYMEENYTGDISLEELANISAVTKQHFCRLFKTRMGMRPLEYLARKRVSVARGLLLNTQMSVAEIGKQVGYDNPTYFGMVYKKYEGISPSEYRKKGGIT